MNPITYIISGLTIGACVVLLFFKTYELGFKKGFNQAIKNIAHIKIMEMHNGRDEDL